MVAEPVPFNPAILTPTPPPDSGGGSVFLGDIYFRPINDVFLQDFVFVQP